MTEVEGRTGSRSYLNRTELRYEEQVRITTEFQSLRIPKSEKGLLILWPLNRSSLVVRENKRAVGTGQTLPNVVGAEMQGYCCCQCCEQS